ncbi:MAG: tRNA 2-thiouridine(34) synthase MnmA [Candidatus Pacebacteria bacterium]|nr:tRNA 2-thiouridine(34) synthase MnmA [Candidatus Paceibacterota bacterium]
MSRIVDKPKKVIVALSGGVDSSVAAILLKKQGYQVEGIFMRLGIATDNESEKNAQEVARKIGIKFHIVNLSKEFKKRIIDYFIFEYKKGRTPNPCVMCNKEIKFGILMDRALKNKTDFIATGHYVKSQKFVKSVKSVKSKVAYKLLKAKDINKDQSYFLYNLNQKTLRRCLFPLGEYTKDEVRKIVGKYKFKIQNQKESQEICFIQDKYYGDFLRKYLKLITGEIVDENNNVLGEHKGLFLYTIGQRRDIGIGGTGPYYVIEMNRRKNQLIVSCNKNDRNLFLKELIVKKVNWISDKVPELPIRIKAKIRYRMEEFSAVVDRENGKYIVKFSKPQRAIMKGQSVVFYKRNEVIGGGIIRKVVG